MGDLGLAARTQSKQQPDDAAVDGSAPPRRSERARPRGALTEVTERRAEGGSDEKWDEDEGFHRKGELGIFLDDWIPAYAGMTEQENRERK